jgi:phage repressor protein C with HTH and peptisase S24 domain
MEPKYINHQTVWVHQQDILLHGEIGIFCYNGNAFCKKLYDNEEGLFLISLNQKYDPIEIKEGDSFKTFGKVVG